MSHLKMAYELANDELQSAAALTETLLHASINAYAQAEMDLARNLIHSHVSDLLHIHHQLEIALHLGTLATVHDPTRRYVSAEELHNQSLAPEDE